MTTFAVDRAGSGEIPALPGESIHRITAADRERLLGENTENLGRYLLNTPSFEAIPRKMIDLDDTVVYQPETIGVVDPGGWERLADTDQLSIIESLAGARVGVDGGLEGPQKPPPPLPKPSKYVGRHRHPEGLIADPHARPIWSDLARIAEPVTEPVAAAPPWARVAIAVGGALALGGGIGVAVILAVVR